MLARVRIQTMMDVYSCMVSTKVDLDMRTKGNSRLFGAIVGDLFINIRGGKCWQTSEWCRLS